ncbi:MAG: hypothetical protein M0D57_05995 [Sphingobacteriales bacterium JAD_PAG50586_3]|nr:MAG: hypothetical protein M0D57_05995 [Sphingobacteriales bacterium JAD_PAG50586_3]
MKATLLILFISVFALPALVNAQTKAPVKKTTTKKKVVKKPVAVAKNDTTYQYYANKKVSVKTAPMVDNDQKIWLYDRAGNVTYTFVNSRKHGVTRTEFRFRADGAVEQAITTQHPDAGIHGYKTTTTFSVANEPEWQTSEKDPMRNLNYPIATTGIKPPNNG